MAGHLVQEAEKRFLSNAGNFPEDGPMSIAMRWQTVLTHLPEARHRHLWENLGDVYASAYASATGYKLWAAYELSLLQRHFWNQLRFERLLMTHFYVYQHEATVGWVMRLRDKWAVSRRAKRTQGRIRKARVYPFQHKWLN